MTTAPSDRILTLDVIRGIAVMGIFSVNVVGMAMIESAYFHPPDYGFDSLGDRIMWAANFILVDGKFRSLFSILFGASMVLAIERGIAAGKPGWKVHYPRMIVLLLFGLAHFYLLWWGDILANYALVGMVAFVFWRLPVRHLMLASVLSLAVMYVPMTVLGIEEVTASRVDTEPDDAGPTDLEIAADKAAHANPHTHLRATLHSASALRPFQSVPRYGLETLGLMLLGMAGYKSGFLTGAWSRRRYAQVAAVCIGASLGWFGQACWRILAAGFAESTFEPWGTLFMFPMHPVAAMGYAALAILAFGGGGALAIRLAAVGRAAFTNYLGATLIGTVLFYGFGFGLYGELSRGEAWLIAPVVWAFMLLWSKWWLDRFRYGPFEWAWRCLARWQWEPMRKLSGPPTPAPESPAA